MTARLHKNETGLASLVIAVLIVIIVTTMVLGFMQIIRREQRRTLDNQLSAQAQYAAESGVNDAQKAILADNYTGTKSQCAPLTPGPGVPASIAGASSNNLSADGNVKYSCLLINPQPETLEFDNIRTAKSTIFPIAPSDDSAINTVTFAWQDKDSIASRVYKGAPNRVNDFVTQAAWGSGNGMLRIQLVPLTIGTILRPDLVSNSRTVFIYPTANGGSPPVIDFGSVTNGEIIAAACADANTPKHCKVTFSNFGATNLIYARVSAIYRPSELTMGLTNASGKISFKGAQTIVDATGRAADVSRRIQVRIPAIGDTNNPEAALRSIDSLCKKFSVYAAPDNVLSDDAADFPACDPNPN